MAGLEKGPDPNCDLDLFDVVDYAVVPTMGSLVSGWALVIPRRPALSVACLPNTERASLIKGIRTVGQCVSELARNVFYFEHGAAAANSMTGCGVDQAHAHVVPLDFNLFEIAGTNELREPWFAVDPDDPWANLSASRDYYIVGNCERAYAVYPQIRQSQFFRRIIATKLGLPTQWNYREFPHNENARATIAYFGRCDLVSEAA